MREVGPALTTGGAEAAKTTVDNIRVEEPLCIASIRDARDLTLLLVAPASPILLAGWEAHGL